jgi:hypothetical protein
VQVGNLGYLGREMHAGVSKVASWEFHPPVFMHTH